MRALEGQWESIFKDVWQHKLLVKELGPYGPERFEGLQEAQTFLRAGAAYMSNVSAVQFINFSAYVSNILYVLWTFNLLYSSEISYGFIT